MGVGDRGEYRDWVAAGKPLPASTANVGTRSEPSLEKIAALEPDLILQSPDAVIEGRDKLERIAPLAAVDPYALTSDAPPSEWEAMRDGTLKIGRLLGKEAEAKALLRRLDETIAEQRGRVEKAGRRGENIVITQTSYAGKPLTRLFDSGSQMLEVARRMGLRNGFDGEHEDYSITEVGLEGLGQVGEADWLLTITQSEEAEDEANAFAAWEDNPAYRSLPVVRAGRVKEIGGDTWTWGGPLSAALVAERIADALTRSKSG